NVTRRLRLRSAAAAETPEGPDPITMFMGERSPLEKRLNRFDIALDPGLPVARVSGQIQKLFGGRFGVRAIAVEILEDFKRGAVVVMADNEIAPALHRKPRE